MNIQPPTPKEVSNLMNDINKTSEAQANRSKLNELKAEYNALDSIERRNQAGLELKSKINELSIDAAKEMKNAPLNGMVGGDTNKETPIIKIATDNRTTEENKTSLKELSAAWDKLTQGAKESIMGQRLAERIKKVKKSIQSESPSEIELKKTRVPKYIHIGTNKILTPKEVVIMRQENGTCKPYVFYADKRCVKVKVSNEDLRAARRANVILIVLRTPKKKGINTFAFTQGLKTVMSYRKWRLANAMNLHMIGEATNQEHQTVEQFIRSEGLYMKGVEIEDLKERFLQDNDPALIVKDIKRMIHLYYQESLKNENSVPNKHSKKSK